MIKKIQSYLNIVLILFVIFGIIYFIINLILDVFDKEEIVTNSNLDNYIKQENLVTSYPLFNMLEECTSNLYQALINKQYEDVHKIVGDKTRKNYTKEEIITILNKYAISNFGANNIMEGNSAWLDKAYTIDHSYIAAIKSTSIEDTLYIIFNLDIYDYTYTIDLIM